MPIVERVATLAAEITTWRRDLHAHPELLYDLDRTAGTVAAKLEAFGCDEVLRGIGRTGVVGVIRGRKGAGNGAGGGPGNVRGKVIGLRADMDALPIEEATGVPYKSEVPGKMHACGHDGHTAMLLGAAKYLAETRNFSGTAVVIFQPAEEGGAGARAMIEDGLFERFAIDEVFGMHNSPGMPVGRFGTRTGPIMAAQDTLHIDIEGVGGHAARPHLSVDSIFVGAQMVTALQSVVSRNIDPLKAAVVSICMFQAGNVDNVIPQEAKLLGTARSLAADVRDRLEERIGKIVTATAEAHGAKVRFEYRRGYPVLVNHAREAAFAASVAAEVAGADAVNADMPPFMGAEDFAYMLEARPGAFVFIGNGDSAGLHNPGYDFDDRAIPFGTSYWVRLVETALA